MINQSTDSLTNWDCVLSLQCQTQKKIKIKSYGDWNFDLYRRKSTQVSRTIYEIIRQNKKSYDFCDYQDKANNQAQLQLSVQQFPQIANVKDAWHKIYVQIQYSQQQFSTKFGFWKISNFKVYDKTGNDSMCSFQANGYFYVGYYGTS